MMKIFGTVSNLKTKPNILIRNEDREWRTDSKIEFPETSYRAESQDSGVDKRISKMQNSTKMGGM